MPARPSNLKWQRSEEEVVPQNAYLKLVEKEYSPLGLACTEWEIAMSIRKLRAFIPIGMNRKSKFVLLIIFALLVVACSSGPAFTDAPQSNAAILEGPVVPTQGAEDGNCSVVVVQVDGLHCDFTASRVGPNWHKFGEVKPLLLAATKHKFSLNISYAEATGGGPQRFSPGGTGDGGTVGSVGEYKATTIAEIFASFEAGHVYRITADYEDEVISVVLWDETNGVRVRTRVVDWSFNSPHVHAGGTGPRDHTL
jgi:hypothetical protein